MKIIECEQGSPEWVRARLGIPTASQFDRIITAKTLQPSKAAQDYANQLAAEWAIGESCEPIDSPWMERGREMEDEARKWYEFATGEATRRVGFVHDDEGTHAGCSPDSLVGDDGGLEIKCPSAKVHVGYLLGGGIADDYRLQIQGSLLVTGRKWWDTLSYSPALPCALVRVARDEACIEALRKGLAAFRDLLDATIWQLREKGVVSATERKAADTARFDNAIFGPGDEVAQPPPAPDLGTIPF